MFEFQVRKDDFSTSRLVATSTEEASTTIAQGEVLVRVEKFSFTANNITYAAAGDMLGYWQFFPPSGEGTEGWGVIPVWGFAEVVKSRVDEIAVGERLFGYFPPASQLKMTPVSISAQRFVDGAAHRSSLPPGYNSYVRIAGETDYDPATDSERMLLWPLHITSYCLWDALQDKNWYGAQQILLLSASSKTSIGLAYALDGDDSAPPTVAVTSARNLALVERLDLYDTCVTYDQLREIDAIKPTVIVDMSGSVEVLTNLQAHLGDKLTYCINVGLTHWDENQPGAGVDSERSEFFFAPSHIQRRLKELGPEGWAQKTSSFMQDTAAKSRAWLKLVDVDGLEGLAAVYPQVCEGRIAADEGLIVVL